MKFLLMHVHEPWRLDMYMIYSFMVPFSIRNSPIFWRNLLQLAKSQSRTSPATDLRACAPSGARRDASCSVHLFVVGVWKLYQLQGCPELSSAC